MAELAQARPAEPEAGRGCRPSRSRTRRSHRCGRDRSDSGTPTSDSIIPKGATDGTLKGKRVAVLVEKFYEDLELWYPVLRLREAGCDVKIVGPKAGETYASKHGYPAKADTAAAAT